MARIRLRDEKSDINRHGNVRYYFRRRNLARKIRQRGCQVLRNSCKFIKTA
jgi:hypothetical protein